MAASCLKVWKSTSSMWGLGALALTAVLMACGGGGGGQTAGSPAPPGPSTGNSPSLVLLAGGLGGSGNLEGVGGNARFGKPMAVVMDTQGNAFVADEAVHVVRKVTPEGVVTDFAGQRGVSGITNGADRSKTLASPSWLSIDGQDNLMVSGNNASYGFAHRIAPDGTMTTMTGLATPMALDLGGRLLSIGYGQLLHWSEAGVPTVLAGRQAHSAAPVDGAGDAAIFTDPVAMAVDRQGNVYVVEVDWMAYEACRCGEWGRVGSTVRRVTPQGVVSTLAGRWGEWGQRDGNGAEARFSGIRGLAIDRDGSVLVADTFGHTLRRVTPLGVVTTVAGVAGQPGYANGPREQVRLNQPTGVAVAPDGALWVIEAGNYTLRRLDVAGQMATVAGRPPQASHADGRGEQARFNGPLGLAVDVAGIVYVADTGNHVIRRIARDGTVTTLAGLPGQPGWVDGTGAAARFNAPTGVALHADGSLWVADHDNEAIRRIDLGGQVTTVADLRSMQVREPRGGVQALPRSLAIRGDGTLLVADDGAGRILARTPGGAWSVWAGHWVAVREGIHDGSGEGATFYGPFGVAAGTDGLVYVADNATVRKITPDRWVSTFVGRGAGYADGLGIEAQFHGAIGVAVDASGQVLVADRFNHLVRRITPTATVSSFIGTPGEWGVRTGSDRPSLGEVMAVAVGPQGVVVISENSVLLATP